MTEALKFPSDTPNTTPVSPQRGFFAVLAHGPRAWRRWWVALVRSIDHAGILEQAARDGSFSFNYNFMVVVAAGIASIGLLLNSPAVIIGAMLISPLMGPIVSSGLAFSTLDVPLGKRGLGTLLLGSLSAVAFASLIVYLSPIKELTPEILARTRPNLFDLIVAVLSGAAGGYAMIRGKGGAIVGVAIATALMPPLAVVGYGLSTAQWPIMRGALLLFVTNMAAISLSVAIVAEWYGFGQGGLRKRFARQAIVALLVLAPLCVPLFFSLKSIAWESFAHASIRSVLENGASSLENGQLGDVQVVFHDKQPPSIQTVVFSSAPQAGFAQRMQKEIETRLGQPVQLRLAQLRDSDAQNNALPLIGRNPQNLEQDAEQALRRAFPLPLSSVHADGDKHLITLLPNAQSGVDLHAWRSMEQELARHFPDWRIQLIPPATALPSLYFEAGQYALDDTAIGKLEASVWALQRWGVSRLRLIGYASSDGGGTARLARQRVNAVEAWLAGQKIDTAQSTIFPLREPSSLERERGQAAFRKVELYLIEPGNPAAQAAK